MRNEINVLVALRRILVFLVFFFYGRFETTLLT